MKQSWITSKPRASALVGVIASTLLFGLGVLLATVRDWGDTIYEQNPLLQTHDKLVSSFALGCVSVAYVAACLLIFYRVWRLKGDTVNRTVCVLGMTLALGMVVLIDRALLRAIVSAATYVQLGR